MGEYGTASTSFSGCDRTTGARYWFSAPDRGEPFNRATADALFLELRAAGLADKRGTSAASSATAKATSTKGVRPSSDDLQKYRAAWIEW